MRGVAAATSAVVGTLVAAVISGVVAVISVAVATSAAAWVVVASQRDHSAAVPDLAVAPFMARAILPAFRTAAFTRSGQDEDTPMFMAIAGTAVDIGGTGAIGGVTRSMGGHITAMATTTATITAAAMIVVGSIAKPCAQAVRTGGGDIRRV